MVISQVRVFTVGQVYKRQSFMLFKRKDPQHLNEIQNNPIQLVETDFTLTLVCHIGIIKPWHYHKIAGANYGNN